MYKRWLDITIDINIYIQLEEYAKKTGYSIEHVVEEAIKEFLNGHSSTKR